MSLESIRDTASSCPAGRGSNRSLHPFCRSGALLGALASLGCLLRWSAWAAPTNEVTSFRQVEALIQEQPGKSDPVRIRGLVLCADEEWNQLFIHDGTETHYFSSQQFGTTPPAGSAVEITGAIGGVGSWVDFTNLSLRVIGPANPPLAKKANLGELGTPGQWLEIRGTIRVAEASRGRLVLSLKENGQSCQCMVMGRPATNDFRWLVGSRVSVRGIDDSKVVNGHLGSPQLMVSGFGEITVLEPSALDLAQIPVVSIDALLSRPLGPWTNSPVHLNGLIASYKPGEYLVVKDATGQIRVRATQTTRAQPDERVNVWGWLTSLPAETILCDGYFDVLTLPVSRGKTPVVTGASGDPPQGTRVLTRVPEIHKLSNQEAARGLTVRVRGVITYADPDWNIGFIQGEGAAAFVFARQPGIRSGQWVELVGRTESAEFAPAVRATRIEVLGTTNLPGPIPADLQDLSDGRLDSLWVQTEGVVRRVYGDSGHARFSLTTRAGRLSLVLPGFETRALPTNLVDSLVSARGACVTDLNGQGQLIGITLDVPSLEQLHVLEAPPKDPFSIGAIPVSTVATFDPERLSGHRVKVTGTVTLAPSGQDFYLQDASSGIRIHPAAEQALHAGDRLEVLGFPAVGGLLPYLEEAVCRRIGTGPLPAPKVLTAEQVLGQGTNDGRFVQLDAELLRRVSRSARPKLVLENGAVPFAAYLNAADEGRKLPDWRPGSMLRLRGICSIQGGDAHDPAGFRLLLPSVEDVWLLSAPPRWTVRDILLLAGGPTVVILAVLTWVAALRQQVRAKTQVIRQKLEERNQFAESLARERTMLAYERDLLGTLLNNLPDSIYFKDLQSRFVRGSKSMLAEYYAYALHRFQAAHPGSDSVPMPAHLRDIDRFAEFLMGKTGTEILDTDPVRSASQDEHEILRTGQPIIGKVERMHHPDGRTTWWLTTKMPWRGADGALVGTFGISRDITSIKEAEAKLEDLHKELLAASREAGMAEAATSVLHNVGNVLNSVNVASSCVVNSLKKSEVASLSKLVRLLREHEGNLGEFLTRDPKGKFVVPFLESLSEHLAGQQVEALKELAQLEKNIEHIKEIVSLQQSCARTSGMAENLRVADLVEDALRMNASAISRRDIRVTKQFEEVPSIVVEKHKLLQILVNLVRNATQACDESSGGDKRLAVRVANGGGRVRVVVSDNGVGISPENLTRIFGRGFTTKKNGHGFGLHSGALAAKEMGGALLAQSEGPGRGASFTLELPAG